jgi:hypothetical protein
MKREGKRVRSSPCNSSPGWLRSYEAVLPTSFINVFAANTRGWLIANQGRESNVENAL